MNMFEIFECRVFVVAWTSYRNTLVFKILMKLKKTQETLVAFKNLLCLLRN
jgi:hypothetical protein